MPDSRSSSKMEHMPADVVVVGYFPSFAESRRKTNIGTSSMFSVKFNNGDARKLIKYMLRISIINVGVVRLAFETH